MPGAGKSRAAAGLSRCPAAIGRQRKGVAGRRATHLCIPRWPARGRILQRTTHHRGREAPEAKQAPARRHACSRLTHGSELPETMFFSVPVCLGLDRVSCLLADSHWESDKHARARKCLICEGLTGRHRHIPRWPRPIGCGPATGLAPHGRRCRQPGVTRLRRRRPHARAGRGAVLTTGRCNGCVAETAVAAWALRPAPCKAWAVRSVRWPASARRNGYAYACVPAALQRAGAGWLAAECGWPEMGCGPTGLSRSQALMASTHRASAMTAASRPRVERFMRRPPAKSVSPAGAQSGSACAATPRRYCSSPTVRPHGPAHPQPGPCGPQARIRSVRRRLGAASDARYHELSSGRLRSPARRAPARRDTLLEEPRPCAHHRPAACAAAHADEYGNWRRRFAQWLPNCLTLARTLVVLGASVRAGSHTAPPARAPRCRSTCCSRWRPSRSR